MRSFAWALVLLGLLLLAPSPARAQDCSPKDKVALCRNYPNPFNPETFIPFRVAGELFASGQKPVVSIRIYNVLAQLVAELAIAKDFVVIAPPRAEVRLVDANGRRPRDPGAARR